MISSGLAPQHESSNAARTPVLSLPILQKNSSGSPASAASVITLRSKVAFRTCATSACGVVTCVSLPPLHMTDCRPKPRRVGCRKAHATCSPQLRQVCCRRPHATSRPTSIQVCCRKPHATCSPKLRQEQKFVWQVCAAIKL